MKTVLLTGATGFVGRQIAKWVTKAECNLVPVVRRGREAAVNKLSNVSRVVSSPDIFQETETWWADQCEGVDLVIHTAWYTSPGEYLQSSKNIDCLAGSLSLAKGATNAGIKRFVGIGTCFEYDLAAKILSVDTPLRPLTPYACAKASLFFGLDHWMKLQSVEFAWCRLFYLYGEGENEARLVPYLHNRLASGLEAKLTNGTQVRDFLDVLEAGRLITEIAMSDQQGPINICSGVPITVRELAEAIADKYGRRDLLKFGERAENLVDPPYVLGIPNSATLGKTW